jgi:hypothetical protein
LSLAEDWVAVAAVAAVAVAAGERLQERIRIFK